MRRLSLGSPVGGGFERWATQALKMIERATYEDIEAAVDAFTVTGSFTPTRTLNADTATLTEVVDLISTLITDIQKRGSQTQG